MTYRGDFNLGSTVFLKFTTVNSTGAPAALSSGGVTVYRDGSTVPDTTGVVLTASFNGVTGFNHVIVEMSTVGFYSSAGDYTAIISSGAASENLAGYVLGDWSLINRRFLSTAGLETLSTLGIETASSLVTVVGSVSVSTASVIGSVTTVTGNVTGSIGSLSTAAAIEVNTEVKDVIATDTYAVPTGLPSTAPTIAGMLGDQHAALRNKVSVSASGLTFHTPAGAVQWVKGLIDDGATYVELAGSTST